LKENGNGDTIGLSGLSISPLLYGNVRGYGNTFNFAFSPIQFGLENNVIVALDIPPFFLEAYDGLTRK
jgi:hypothetical protein